MNIKQGFLVYSNLAYLIPSAYAFYVELYYFGLAFLLTGVASFLYHYDNNNSTYKFADLYLSSCIILITFMALYNLFDSIFAINVMLASYKFLEFFALIHHHRNVDNLYIPSYFFTIGILGCIPVYFYTNTFNEINYLSLSIAGACFAIGFTCKMLVEKKFKQYFVFGHTLWHFMTALCIFFTLFAHSNNIIVNSLHL